MLLAVPPLPYVLSVIPYCIYATLSTGASLTMKFLLDKIAKLNIGWNERPLTEADVHLLCRRYKVTVEELPLRVSGFYYSVMGRHFIAVNSNLRPDRKLFVLFHEFAHFLLHAPDSGATANFHGIGKKTRKEIEADLFALVALIPQRLLLQRSSAELVDEGFEPDDVHERTAIFDRYGI